MPLNILHISTRLIVGGSQENTVLSCEGQARLGHDVHLAFGPIFGPEGSMLDRVRTFATDNGARITTHDVPDMVREISPLRDLRCYRQLRALIADIKPDVVHTHSSKAGILGRWAAWNSAHKSKPRPAVIHTVHGPPFMPIEGGLAKRTAVRSKNAIYTLAERFAAKRCHRIVSVADAMTEQFLARCIGDESQYITVRSGMEIEPFVAAGDDPAVRARVRQKLGIDADDFVIGTVARLAEHKGHDDLLDALADDLRAKPDWKLLWIGDGWWRDRLLARAESLGVRAQIATTGLVPPRQVALHMAAMDVLAHPSAREGLPRTVPQALLCGICPVAYDVDGTGEACRTGETGVLVPPGDVPGLRAAIARLAEDPNERQRLAANGRAECCEQFSAHRMVEELERVYALALV
ncbi:MAG: glycosyltransferase [Planctomycetota bacterium]